MRNKIKAIVKKLAQSRFSAVFAFPLNTFMLAWYRLLCAKANLAGVRKPSQAEIQAVKQNVTFFYKSFERQAMAKRLYRNIQKYYPGVKVIIADDSKQPLDL